MVRQYLNREAACEEFQCSETTIKCAVAGIRGLIGRRYGPYAIRGEGRLLQVRYAVLTDYMKYREWLEDKNHPGAPPPFDIREAERELGVRQDVIYNVQLDEERVASAVVRMLAQKIGEAAYGN